MRSRIWSVLCRLTAVSVVLAFSVTAAFFLTAAFSVAMAGEAVTGAKEAAAKKEAKSPRPPAGEEATLSVEAARERAKLVHNIYAATLDVMHHRYFLDDRSTIPARAMEDVFAQIARESKINARWFAVNAKAMSIDHKPQDDFEKEAARALSKGKEEYEKVEDGGFLRAEGIPLTAGCLSCHGTFGVTSTSDRIVGLSIRIPLTKKK